MKAFSKWILGVAAIGLTAGCDDDRGPDDSMVVERPAEREPVDHGDGTFTRVYRLPPKTLMELMAITNRADDPFARIDVPDPPEEIGDLPEHVLKRLGVGFPEGTGAVYDIDSESMTVRQTEDWLDYIDPLLESVDPGEKNLLLRVEIYEVPTALALRLEQSAADHPEHTPEWEALRKIVDAGEADFVTSGNVQMRSGQRSIVTEGEAISVFSGFEKPAEGESESPVPVFEERVIGTTTEFDAVLGPDDITIDLFFEIEHHTGPPEFTAVEIPVPGSGDRVSVELPSFHAKSIKTTITMRDGDVRLVGSWRPTGRAESEEREVMRIVFLQGAVQRVGGRR